MSANTDIQTWQQTWHPWCHSQPIPRRFLPQPRSCTSGLNSGPEERGLGAARAWTMHGPWMVCICGLVHGWLHDVWNVMDFWWFLNGLQWTDDSWKIRDELTHHGPLMFFPPCVAVNGVDTLGPGMQRHLWETEAQGGKTARRQSSQVIVYEWNCNLQQNPKILFAVVCFHAGPRI